MANAIEEREPKVKWYREKKGSHAEMNEADNVAPLQIDDKQLSDHIVCERAVYIVKFEFSHSV